jgi:TolA-binding protein
VVEFSNMTMGAFSRKQRKFDLNVEYAFLNRYRETGSRSRDANSYRYVRNSSTRSTDPNGTLTPLGGGIAAYCLTFSALQVNDLKNQINQLQTQLNSLNSQISQLQSNMENKQSSGSCTMSDINDYNDQLAALLSTQTQLSASIASDGQSVNELTGIELACTLIGFTF